MVVVKKIRRSLRTMVNFKYALITIHVPPEYTPVLNGPITFIIGQLEICPTTQRRHYQLYAESSKPLSRTQWKQHLGNNGAHIELRRGSQQQAIDYCTKQETRDPDANQINLGQRHQQPRSPTKTAYKEALEAETYEEAVSIIKEQEPRDFVLFNNQILNTFSKVFAKDQMLEKKTFKIDVTAREMLESRALVLSGRSGVGKTQYAISHFDKPLIVSHIDDLKKLNPSHDGIIFDDMNFKHWPPNSCIHLVDLELDRSINVKYGTAKIPARMPRIFTTNRNFNELFSEQCNEEEWEALNRRTMYKNIDNKLY